MLSGKYTQSCFYVAKIDRYLTADVLYSVQVNTFSQLASKAIFAYLLSVRQVVLFSVLAS
jgi:hypothetical protein